MKFLLSVAPNRVDPCTQGLCTKAEEYWRDALQQKGGYTFDRPTDRGHDMFSETNIATICLSNRLATSRYYDSAKAWPYHANETFANIFLSAIPGEWIHVYDDGRFEPGETFNSGNAVSLGRCQIIPG